MKDDAAVREGGGGIPLRGIFRPCVKVALSGHAPDGTGRAVDANLAVSVTIQPGSLTPQGFSADSGVYLQISNSFCTERTGVDRLHRSRSQTGRGSPGFHGHQRRVFEGVSAMRPNRALLRRPQISGWPESGGPSRAKDAEAHTRVFSLLTANIRGAHNNKGTNHASTP